MAITVKLLPQTFQPVYNEMTLILDSTNKSQPLFKYVANANIYGVAQSNFDIFTNPQGYGISDIHSRIATFVNYSLDHDETATFQRAQSAYTKYNLSITESYIYSNNIISVTNSGGNTQLNFSNNHYYSVGDKINVSSSSDVPAYDGVQRVTSIPSTNAVVTTKTFTTTATGTAKIADNSPTLVTATTKNTSTAYAFNGAINWEDVPDWDYTLYVPGFYFPTGATSQFLSTIPSTSTVKLDDRIWVNFYNPGGVKYLEVTSNRGTFQIENGPFSASTDENKFLTIGVGPWNLINTTDNVVTSGTPILDSATTTYSLALTDVSGNTLSETLTFNIDSSCSKYENYRMIYMDPLGSFQCVNFDLASKKNININKTTYKKNYGSYNPATNTYGWNSWDRGTTQIDSNINIEYTINTNWVNETTGAKVIELISSPEVYHLREDGKLFAVEVMTRSLEEKKKLNTKMINYQIKFRYANKSGVQR